MTCNEITLRKIFVENGFKAEEYPQINGETEIEYIPTDDRTEIIINKIFSIMFQGDMRIRLGDGELIFLSDYQDYHGGFFNNRVIIQIEEIQNLKIKKENF